MEFHVFDADYLSRLAARDAATESHFAAYFEKFLFLKLRARRLTPELADDITQETLFRVLKRLRQPDGVLQPERFGAFVNSVCNNVLREFGRDRARHGPGPEEPPDPQDERVDLDAPLLNEQRKRLVGSILAELPAKDREILRLLFFEDLERDEICARLGIDAGYLRVMLYRAKGRFQEKFHRRHGITADGLVLLLMCNAIVAGATIIRGPN